MRVYKILSRAEWAAARAAGRFEGSAVDLADGYIHFSTAAQAQATAAKWFAGQDDLVVLEVEADDLPDLKWEPARGGDLFPHLYRPLEVALVRAARAAPLDAAGVPQVEAAR
ncbi:MAG: DUF952 domain-containing protein [Phenylobacterium sp.]|uniref:DUF952 domain-containing protein n=1 Tax=Phenylobacterium sp. TaxID=1871053 RepID=UPI00391BDC67